MTNFFSSSDFIKELKKDAQLCKLKYEDKELTQYSDPDEFNKALIDNVKSTITKLAASTSQDYETYINNGIKKAYTWYNALFWIYIILSIIYLVFTFSLTIDIEANDGKTVQIPDWSKIFYIVFGISLLWIGILVFVLLWWLVSPRLCDASPIRATYGLIIFIIIYVLLTQIALVGPLIKDEVFSDDSSLKYDLTTAGTWVLFGLIIIIISFYIYRMVANRKKSNTSNKS